ncbi:MAG: hypothetical protein P1V51_03590 [Deltaproteobacteria bacterium]|nr:hypothetical protein [Deltaproteobacteria bacterium]
MRSEARLLALLGVASIAALGCEPAPVADDPSLDPAVRVAACTPDNDGVLEAGELAFVPDLKARYRVRESAIDFDTAGRLEEGVTVWDLSRPDPESEPVARLGLSALAGQWFAGDFPGADLVVPLDTRGDTLGAVHADEGGLHLHGFASAQESPPEGRTLAVYQAPVTLTPLPMALGGAWTETVRASNATLLGLPGTFDDAYEVEVTGQGRVILPDLILENTLRVTLRLERTLLAGEVRQISHVWMHECLGEVARATGPLLPLSEPYPDELTTIVELRRLSL